MPGSSTKTFFALVDPTLSIPTLLYRAGVPGAAKPLIQATCTGVAGELAGVLVGELVPQLDRSMPMHTVAIDTETGRFSVGLSMCRVYHGLIHDHC